jgi:protein-disulfide isomerase/uncharacterized membrane protein
VNDSRDAELQKQRGYLTIIGLLLALLGLGFAVYTAMHHLSLKSGAGGDFACNINQTFNCDAVAMSAYSELMGIPMGVWGAGYFVGLIVLLLVSKFIPKNEEDCWQGYAILTVAGFAVSVVLAIISTTVIGSVCLACTGIYAVCLLQLGAVGILRKAIPWPLRINSVANGALVALVGVVAVVVAFQFIGPRFSQVAEQDLPVGPDGERTTLLPGSKDIPIHKSAYSGLGEDYRKGSDDAKVTIVEFADFECPACAGAADLMKQVREQFGDNVLIVFKNYPLDRTCNSQLQQQIHKNACEAATFARCAGEFDKFWEFHDQLFKSQDAFGTAAFRGWALGLGIPESGLDKCLNSSGLDAKIQDDMKVGDQVGVSGTPTIFINGRKYIGPQSLQAISVEINRLLN